VRTLTSKAPTAKSIPHAQERRRLKRLFKHSPFPRHSESRSAETPGSIHEAANWATRFARVRAAFDNTDLLVACVVGDGEAETGPLATSWHSNNFSIRPRRRRAAILHLNGSRCRPTVCARIPRDELEALFRGYGYSPHFVEAAIR